MRSLLLVVEHSLLRHRRRRPIEVIEIKARLPHAGPIAGAVVPLSDDPQGRTWDMRDLFQGAGYAETFRAIVDELRGRYDLAA